MPSPYYSSPWQFTYPLSHHAITADHAKQQLQDFSTSPDEMHTLHRYIKCCSGDLRMQLQAAFDSAIAQRSHCLLRPSLMGVMDGVSAAAATGPQPWLNGCKDDPVLAAVQYRAWERKRRDVYNGRMAVMTRCECGVCGMRVSTTSFGVCVKLVWTVDTV